MRRWFGLALAVVLLGGLTVAPAEADPPRWQPAPRTTWQVQYTGKPNDKLKVQAYNVDLFDTSTQRITAFHSRGVKVICYYSSGSWEDWRPDAAAFPAQTKADPMDDWPGERWLDVRHLDLLAPIMSARLDLAASKGCDAVDPDNVDGYTNDTGAPITYADQLAYNRWTAEAAHARGLAVGLKNDLDQIADLIDVYDFTVNEQCWEYSECDLLKPWIAAGKAVFGIEYSSKTSKYCKPAKANGFSTLRKKLSLDAYRYAC